MTIINAPKVTGKVTQITSYEEAKKYEGAFAHLYWYEQAQKHGFLRLDDYAGYRGYGKLFVQEEDPCPAELYRFVIENDQRCVICWKEHPKFGDYRESAAIQIAYPKEAFKPYLKLYNAIRDRCATLRPLCMATSGYTQNDVILDIVQYVSTNAKAKDLWQRSGLNVPGLPKPKY